MKIFKRKHLNKRVRYLEEKAADTASPYEFNINDNLIYRNEDGDDEKVKVVGRRFSYKRNEYYGYELRRHNEYLIFNNYSSWWVNTDYLSKKNKK